MLSSRLRAHYLVTFLIQIHTPHKGAVGSPPGLHTVGNAIPLVWVPDVNLRNFNSRPGHLGTISSTIPGSDCVQSLAMQNLFAPQEKVGLKYGTHTSPLDCLSEIFVTP